MRIWISFILCLVAQVLLAQGDSVFVQFSKPGGIYPGEFKLELTCSVPDAKIYYTTDGSAPTSASFRYADPIAIEGVMPIRAKAYVNGKPSAIATNTYFTERDYTMAVISINTEPAYLFSDSLGILAKGYGADTVPPYYGANFWKGWEREMNIEFYESDGTLAFNQAAGIRVFGGWSKSLPQKSLTIVARSKYGDNRFEYPIFEDRPMDEYKTFILRNSGSDFNITHFRDAYLTQLCSTMDLEIQAYRPAAVYLNGRYWGIMNVREKLNEHYLTGNFGVDKDSVDLMKHRMDLQVGNRDNYKALLKYLKDNDLSQDSIMDYVAHWVDVSNYLDYHIAETFIDNRDAGGNIRFWRAYEPDARWRWILFDTDMSFGVTDWDGWDHDAVAMNLDPAGPAWPNPPWSTFIIRKLMEHPDVKNDYLVRWCDHLNYTFHPARISSLLDEFVSMNETEMAHHVDRWRPWGNDDMEDWSKSVDVMRTFGMNRANYCRRHLMAFFGIQDTSKVSISFGGEGGGYLEFNSLQLEEAYEGIYFDSTNLVLSAVPDFNSQFAGWEGVEGDNPTSWMLLNDMEIVAHFDPKPKSPDWGSIVITEISSGDSISEDWIELFNHSAQAIDLSDWFFCDERMNNFSLPPGTTIEAGEFLIVARDLQAFINAYSDTLDVIGNFNFGIRRLGEWIGLYDADLLPVDTLTVPMVMHGQVLGLGDPDDRSTWIVEPATPGKKSPRFPVEEERSFAMYYMGAGVLVLILIFFLVKSKSRKPKKMNISDHSESGS